MEYCAWPAINLNQKKEHDCFLFVYANTICSVSEEVSTSGVSAYPWSENTDQT